MPRGVTPTRVRRRQSDAKWRASVAMCYNIMKNVIPNQKKLGRRKVSKALTLKETERHIVSLEKILKELLEERAPFCGKVIMIEKDDGSLVPATFDDIRQDFAMKQHTLFTCTTTGCKKRYNVPSDMEASLDQLTQQTCELVTMDRKEAEISFPHLRGKMENQRLKSQTSVHRKLESLLNTPDDDVADEVPRINKTTAEKTHTGELKAHTTDKRETTEKSMTALKKSAQKACKQLPFVSLLQSPRAVSKVKSKSLLKSRDGRLGTNTSNLSTPKCEISPVIYSPTSDLTSVESLSPYKKTPCQILSKPLNHTGNPRSVKPLSRKSTNTSQATSGFTPVKLPYGLDNRDPMMTFPGTPAKSTICSPLACLSMPETPGSCFNGVTYFELSEEEDVTSLLCTESIDGMDLDINFTDRSSSEIDMTENGDQSKTKDVTNLSLVEEEGTRNKTKARRRLDKDYGCEQDQIVPRTDNSCMEFDGYLLFHQHSAEVKDPDCSSQSEMVLNTAHMWEKLEAEDRALYARMASLEQSEDSNDLSADLLNIDLKPLHTEPSRAYTSEDSQEVPNLVLDLSQEMHGDFQPHFIEGYEDLGVFYHSDEIKEDVSGTTSDEFNDFEKQSQVVPQMG